MLLTHQEIQRLLEIVDYHSSFVTGNALGKESLSDYDRFILNKYGIDPDKITGERESTYYEMYFWGKLSQQLNNIQAGKITYDDFSKYIKRGQYVPMNTQEKKRYDISRQKSYSHIKGLGDRIKASVSGIMAEESQKRRAEYERAISEEISRGVVDRKSVRSISLELGNRMNEWNRDWDRIVNTEYNNIFQQGRAERIREEKGSETKVYKEVYPQACKYCIKAYLTNGIGSQPKLFVLSDLEANGDNIGKKTADWLPVLNSMHPHCRCNLFTLPKGYVWNEESKSFQPESKEKLDRPKAILKVGDKEFKV